MIALFERFNTTHENLHLYEMENEDVPGQLTICIEGTIETYNSDAFQDTIASLVKHSDHLNSIIFDLLKVSYISSTAVGALIRLIKLTKEKNISLSFINVNDKVKSVIKVLGFAKYVQIADEPDAQKFPVVIQCPGCFKKVKVNKPGTYNCPYCKETFTFHEYNATM